MTCATVSAQTIQNYTAYPPFINQSVPPLVMLVMDRDHLDDGARVWLFFGTGRYYNLTDKTDTRTQYLFGVKDSVLTANCSQTSVTSCWGKNLVNVSNAVICTTCASGTNQVTGVTGVTTLTGTSTTTLQGLVQSMDGWFTTLPGSGERSLVTPTLIGGIVFFPTFMPSTDVCIAAGTSNLFALFYQTGSAWMQPVIGTTQVGGNTNVNRSISLGTGLASQIAIQIGSQGSGGSGTAGAGGGCQGGIMGVIQSSTGALNQTCINSAMSVASRYISWINQRD